MCAGLRTGVAVEARATPRSVPGTTQPVAPGGKRPSGACGPSPVVGACCSSLRVTESCLAGETCITAVCQSPCNFRRTLNSVYPRRREDGAHILRHANSELSVLRSRRPPRAVLRKTLASRAASGGSEAPIALPAHLQPLQPPPDASSSPCLATRRHPWDVQAHFQHFWTKHRLGSERGRSFAPWGSMDAPMTDSSALSRRESV